MGRKGIYVLGLVLFFHYGAFAFGGGMKYWFSCGQQDIWGGRGCGFSGFCTKAPVEKRKSRLKQLLEQYLTADPAIVQKLRTNKDYSYNNIEAIIHEYNGDMRSPGSGSGSSEAKP